MSNAIPSGFRALPLLQAQLSLAAVLKCGQSFRWSAHPLTKSATGHSSSDEVQCDGAPVYEYRLCLKNRVVCLRQTSQAIFYKTELPRANEAGPSKREEDMNSQTLSFIRDYFQLDVDLVELYDSWSACDPIFSGISGRFSGIRMLRQDPWECLISFICSANNNISRISKMVQNLCIHFSPPLVTLSPPLEDGGPQAYHSFPPPSVLAEPSVATKLRALGFGYRADFIQKTASMLIDDHRTDEGVYKYLRGLRELSTEDARAELLKLMGVGRKVADCILLMSLDKTEVVPVDTHVYQIAVKYYGLKGTPGKGTMSPKLYDAVNTKLANIWGAYAGWAHSVLFTADLKSFASYGLPTPSPSASPEKRRKYSTGAPSPSPSPSPRKRRKERENDVQSTAKIVASSENTNAEMLNEAEDLAERVKKRRRSDILRTKTSLAVETKAEW